MLSKAALASIAAMALCLALSTAAHGAASDSLSTGKILLASDKLGDPNFAEAVVLIIDHDGDEGTVGVIINRRTDVPLTRVFSHVKGASRDPVYQGGPVEVTGGQGLLRTPLSAPDGRRVVEDVYVTGSKDLIEKSVASRMEASKFRVYLGYAGWAPGQLEAEIQAGAWSILQGSARIIFDNDPDSLWSRLTHESNMQIAAASQMLAGMPRFRERGR